MVSSLPITPSELQRQFCSMKSLLTRRSPSRNAQLPPLPVSHRAPALFSGSTGTAQSCWMKLNPSPPTTPAWLSYSYFFPVRTGNKSCNFSTSGPFDSHNGLWERHICRHRSGANKSFATWATLTLFSPGRDTEEPCRAAPGDGQSRFPPPLSRPGEGLEVSPASRIDTSSLRWFKRH